MTLSNQEIINVLNAFQEIADKTLPVDLAFDLHRINNELMGVYTAYIRALDKPMKQEQAATPGDLKNQDVVQELLGKEVEVRVTPIPREKFDDVDGLTLAQVFSLAPIIDG